MPKYTVQEEYLYIAASDILFCPPELPDPPVNVQVPDNGALWVVIRWQPDFDGNRPIQRFILYQRVLNGNFVVATTLDVEVPMFVDGFFRFNISVGILAFTNYSFAVEACNELGCSEMSAASEEIRTDQYRKSNLLST